jgi:hypothetical protein
VHLPRVRARLLVLLAVGAGCGRIGYDAEPQDQGQPVGPAPSANPTLGTIGARSVLDLGGYQCDRALDINCGSIFEWSSFAFDGRRRQILVFGGQYQAARRTDVAVFDLAGLTWGSAYPSTSCPDMVPANVDTQNAAWLTTGHPLPREVNDLLVLDERSGDLVLLAPAEFINGCSPGLAFPRFSSSVAHYHPDTHVWEFTAPLAGAWPAHAAAEYDPVSGRIVVLSEYGLWTYDPTARTIAKHLGQLDLKKAPLDHDAQLLYFPPTQRMYNVSLKEVVTEVTLDRANWAASTVTPLAIAGQPPDAFARGWAYDGRRRNFGGGVRAGVFFTLDPMARRWGREQMSVPAGQVAPPDIAFFTISYDPGNDVFIFTNGYNGGPSAYHTWAFRP